MACLQTSDALAATNFDLNLRSILINILQTLSKLTKLILNTTPSSYSKGIILLSLYVSNLLRRHSNLQPQRALK